MTLVGVSLHEATGACGNQINRGLVTPQAGASTVQQQCKQQHWQILQYSVSSTGSLFNYGCCVQLCYWFTQEGPSSLRRILFAAVAAADAIQRSVFEPALHAGVLPAPQPQPQAVHRGLSGHLLSMKHHVVTVNHTVCLYAGFIYLPTYAHSYNVTKSRSDLQQALAAAEALAWNYNPATKSLRTFEGWQPDQATDGYKQIVIIGECHRHVRLRHSQIDSLIV